MGPIQSFVACNGFDNPGMWGEVLTYRKFVIDDGSGTADYLLTDDCNQREGDIVIFLLVCDTFSAGTLNSSGWTVDFTAGSSPGSRFAWKQMGAVPDLVMNVSAPSLGSTGGSSAVVTAVLRGADRTTPQDAASTNATNAASAFPDAPSLTTATDRAWRWVVGFGDDDSAGDGVVAPSGFNLLCAHQVVPGIPTGTVNDLGGTLMVAHRVEPTAGAVDPGAFSGGSFSDNTNSVHSAFRKAAG